MTSLAVIVPSCGRPTLSRTLDSIAPSLQPGDELLVDVNNDRDWGHAARNRRMRQATADWLLFQNDDDWYCPDALNFVRRCVKEWAEVDRMHVFRMQYTNGAVLYRDPVLRLGNIGSPMAIVPNIPEKLGTWGDRYEGDWDFISETAEKLGEPPFWHEEVICMIDTATNGP